MSCLSEIRDPAPPFWLEAGEEGIVICYQNFWLCVILKLAACDVDERSIQVEPYV